MRIPLCLSILLVAGAPALAQTSMPSGKTERAPRQHVAAEAGDQIRASDAIGNEVRGAGGKGLGKIENLYLARGTGTVDLALVAGKPLAWSDLRFEARPAPHFVVGETKDDRDKASTATIDKDRYLDVKALLGEDVLGADGKKLGTVADLVLQFEGGAPAALLVAPARANAGKENPPRIVAWNEAKPRLENGELRIALAAEALERQPEFLTMAPDPASGVDTSGSSAPTEPGTKLGTGSADPSVSAPATHRR
jgi:sporulation protein YlmC with PRC-barrel domain